MVQKGRTSVYIDLDQARRVKEDLGIELSRLTSQALDIADSDIFGDIAVGLRIKITEELIAETENELMLLERRQIVLQNRLQEAIQRKETIRTEWQRVQNSVMLSRHIYQLNQVIIASRYDIPTIRVAGAEFISKIEILSPLWNLEIHVREFKKEMS
jgi:hypothetical protein